MTNKGTSSSIHRKCTSFAVKMKFPYILLLLCVGVMSVVVFQAGRQEMKLINIRARMVDSKAETVREEHAIAEMKTQLVLLKQTLLSLNTDVLNLRKKKQDIDTLTQDFTQSVQSCNSEKVGAENKKKETEAAITDLQVGDEKAKQKATEEIQALKQQILDRDKALCVFADTTKAEARSLCGMPPAVK